MVPKLSEMEQNDRRFAAGEIGTSLRLFYKSETILKLKVHFLKLPGILLKLSPLPPTHRLADRD
jgi:hypothetical protein